MLVRLDADRGDLNACIKKFFKKLLILRRRIEIVNKECSIRISRSGSLENFLNQSYSAVSVADPCNRIVVLIEDRHDDDFIDYIPDVDRTLESSYVSVDPRKLLIHDYFI